MASGIVLGINYLHTMRNTLIHGDLKMRNVLVSEGYKPKVSESVSCGPETTLQQS